MDRRTILFVMNTETPEEQISEAANAAAKGQHHLACLVLGAAPALPIYAYGVPPYGGMNIPDNWSELVALARQDQDVRVNEVEALLARSGASGHVQSVMCATVDIKNYVATAARVSDEAFIAANLRETPELLREAAYGVLYNAPIGLRLNGALSQPVTRVFVAWDSSAAASSAVHTALPYLKEAQDVLIGCIDPIMTDENDGQDPGTDVAAWLSHHGCSVTVSQFPSGGLGVDRCIQDRAREFGADLIVMGAYGHARMIQVVFGGTTRSMIEQTEIPVLLAH